MLTFSTVFPLSNACASSDIALLIKKWLIGSQHSHFGEELKLAGAGERQWEESIGSEHIQGLSSIENEVDYVAIR